MRKFNGFQYAASIYLDRLKAVRTLRKQQAAGQAAGQNVLDIDAPALSIQSVLHATRLGIEVTAHAQNEYPTNHSKKNHCVRPAPTDSFPKSK